MPALYYLVITSSEDGISIKSLSHAELLKRLNEKYWGGDDVVFLDKIPETNDGYFQGFNIDKECPVLILKAEIVVPKPKKVVLEFEL